MNDISGAMTPVTMDKTTDTHMQAISYADFGERFFAYAVTRERLEARLARLQGEVIDFGPRAVAGVARVSARGTIGRTAVVQVGRSPLTFEATVPVAFDIVIRVAGAPQHFHADVNVAMTTRVCAYDSLRVRLDVTPPQAHDVRVRLQARSWGASVLNAVSSIEHELRRVVAQQVEVKLQSPDIRAMCEFDIAAYIDEVLDAPDDGSAR